MGRPGGRKGRQPRGRTDATAPHLGSASNPIWLVVGPPDRRLGRSVNLQLAPVIGLRRLFPLLPNNAPGSGLSFSATPSFVGSSLHALGAVADRSTSYGPGLFPPGSVICSALRASSELRTLELFLCLSHQY